jgi:hypothetical protein
VSSCSSRSEIKEIYLAAENKNLTEEEDIQRAFKLAEYIKNGTSLFGISSKSSK